MMVERTVPLDETQRKAMMQAPSEHFLEVRDLWVYYGAAAALKGISFHVDQGEVVVIIGANGAGKSTTMKTVSGVSELLKSVKGLVFFRGAAVEKLPAHKIAALGMAHVPEGRRIFGASTVEDNLLLGAYRRYGRQRSRIQGDLEAIYERFPVLKDRRNRPAGLLSGGEQQMLAISRALMSRPHFLLLDEPSLGLAPLLVNEIFAIITELAREGSTILLVEQMANKALEIADRAYVLETGQITMEGTGRELLADPRVKEAYLGGLGSASAGAAGPVTASPPNVRFEDSAPVGAPRRRATRCAGVGPCRARAVSATGGEEKAQVLPNSCRHHLRRRTEEARSRRGDRADVTEGSR